jgi:hypothetical protein
MEIYLDFTKKIKEKIESGEASWVKKKKDGSPAKKKKKRKMKKGEYRDKDGKICKSTDESSKADEEAGYPPNCNEGYKEKDGKCVPVENKEVPKKN